MNLDNLKALCKNCNSDNCFYDIEHNFTYCKNCYKGSIGLYNKQIKWDNYYLDIAKEVSKISKDPSTKTGSIIVSPKNTIISTGYNGFPIGIFDDKEVYNNREVKYLNIIHCEMNSILSAKTDLTNCTLYIYPFMSCFQCSKHIIQTGINRCVAPIMQEKDRIRWGKEIDESKIYLEKVGIQVDLLDYK